MGISATHFIHPSGADCLDRLIHKLYAASQANPKWSPFRPTRTGYSFAPPNSKPVDTADEWVHFCSHCA